MCGIAGMLDDSLASEARQAALRGMIAAIRHRGPDDMSTWLDPNGRCGLAHARLSIIDLEGGGQPIENEDGSIVVVFNGEIYNYRELKKELVGKGHVFKTQADTEVLVHLFEEDGVAMARRLRGMFAIALWDRRHRRLHLFRDHIGKKPLHYFRQGGQLYFASEYKAFLGLQNFTPALDYESLHYLLNLRWLPKGRTLMRDVEQVLPGEVVTVDGEHVHKERYWLPTVAPYRSLREEEHEENILHLLRQSVGRRLVSDVPVGIFLSGGLDSSAILAMMAEQMHVPVRSFSLGFGNENDETQEAAETAAYYGAQHTNYMVDENPLRHFEQTIWHSELPKVNAVQVYLLAEQARKEVKVVMSGLGGDELFGGYDNYLFIKYGGLFADIPFPSLGDKLRSLSFRLMGGGENPARDQLRRGIEMGFSLGRRDRFYSILRNAWDVDDGMYGQIYHRDIVQSQKEYSTASLFTSCLGDRGRDFLSEAMVCELREKLVGDQILVEDRNMMAHGLEGRAPFLDVDLIEYAAGIPPNMKIDLLRGRKYILKKALKRVLPEFVFERPKKGFAFDPVKQFTRDLKPLVEEVLSPSKVAEMGLFNYAYIRRLLDHPPSNNLHWHYWLLWTMVGVAYWDELFVRQSRKVGVDNV
ncbi:MAG: asparagine synthase (glutamine-hydrolyzing) [Betaproteobacteria bacterium]|nr:asparagine synthase (glutamine-hydrolyzing) [Betaproteobacteria bacterium]